MTLLRVALAFLVFIGTMPQAFAHTKSETQSVWRIVGNTVHVTFTIPEIEVPKLKNADGTPLSEAQLVAYVRERVTVLDKGEACERSEDVRAVVATQGFRRFEFTASCPDAEISIHSGASSTSPDARDYAQIVTGEFISQLRCQSQN